MIINYRQTNKEISEVKVLSNVTELRRVLETVNHLSKFSSSLPTLTCPLCLLLSKSYQWEFRPNQDAEFIAIKRELIDPTALSSHDPNAKTKISSDASSYELRLGAMLLQIWTVGSLLPIPLYRVLTKHSVTIL